MFILGVTGTSGSGKSLFCSFLGDLGAAVIDCDGVYHELLANSPELNCDIISAFPEAEKNGLADRPALARAVFADGEKLKLLERIVFPHIGAKIEGILAELKQDGKRLAVLDAPTLFESGADSLCGHIVAVIANRETLIARLADRDGLDRDNTVQRIDSRPEKGFYIAHDCEIIENNGDIDFIKAEALRIFNEALPEGKRNG